MYIYIYTHIYICTYVYNYRYIYIRVCMSLLRVFILSFVAPSPLITLPVPPSFRAVCGTELP